MFKCGAFSLTQGGLINFYGLEIPCQNYIILNLVDTNSGTHDGTIIRYPCFMEGHQSADLILPGPSGRSKSPKLSDIASKLSNNTQLTLTGFTAASLAHEFSIGFEEGFFSEGDFLYSIHSNTAFR